jgi:ubiquinone biosynthesis protein COQ9
MKAMNLTATRDKILEATLTHVAFDGWTRAALTAGVKDAGFQREMALRAFPGGIPELVEHFADWADRRMLAALAKKDVASMKVRERVAAAVRARLEAFSPHREAVRRLLAYLALPGHAGLAARLTWHTANAVWYAAGDTATDFNYYTKRALLMPIYTTTVLYWLSDDSDGFVETWGYLDRRIADIMRIPKLTAGVRDALGRLPLPFARFRRAGAERDAGRR